MAFGNIDWVALIVAFVASYAFSAIYYISLAGPWMAAIGKTKDELKSGGGAAAYVIAIAGQITIAYTLSVLAVSLEMVSIGGALTVALSVWIAFVMTTMLINHRFQLASWSHSIIDGAHWLGVFAIQAIAIGLIAG